LDSSKQVLTSSSSPPSQPTSVVVSGSTDHITQEAYVTETSGQTAHATTTKSSKGGPLNAIRSFFHRIFINPFHRHEERQKSANAAAVETTETITTTTTTVATSNPPRLS